MAKLSIELNRYFFEEDRSSHVKLGDILALAEERIFGFLFVVLSLPSALPLPAPGYSTPFGVLLFLLAVQLMAGAQRPWLPQRLYNSSIKLEKAQNFVKAGIPWLRRIEAIAKPRMSWICTSLPGRIILGSAIALMAISMMIPVPGTNTLPAMVIFVIGFGLLEDDGLISTGGVVSGILIAVLMVSVIIAFYRGGTSLLDYLKEQLRR